jgi:DnaJ-class molecular chaperone
MDYYSILEIPKSANDSDIKKAYRKLAMKYHPDKNEGDKTAEDKFKKISEAYQILSDPKKRSEYDLRNNPFNRQKATGFGFDDFVNNFKTEGFRNRRAQSNEQARRSQGRTYSPPKTDYLNIILEKEILFTDAIQGSEVIITFIRNKINYTGNVSGMLQYNKLEEEKEVTIKLDLKAIYLNIKEDSGKYTAKVRLSKLGNEDVIDNVDMWGEIEQYPLIGDVHVNINFILDESINLEGNNIVQKVQLSLYDVLFDNKKITVEAVTGKKYNVNLKKVSNLSTISMSIPEEGIYGENGKRGEYLIKFEVIVPQIDELDSEKLSQIKELLNSLE